MCSFWQSDQCRRQVNETTKHVLQCQDERRLKGKHLSLTEFESSLQHIHAAPNTRECALMLLRHCLLDTPLDLDTAVGRSDLCKRMLDAKLSLGTFAILQGRLGSPWATNHQDKAVRDYAPWRDGHEWARLFLQALWQLTWPRRSTGTTHQFSIVSTSYQIVNSASTPSSLAETTASGWETIFASKDGMTRGNVKVCKTQ
jgi:hypothetical protein